MRVKLQIRWAGVITAIIAAMATIIVSSLLYSVKKSSQLFLNINEQAISKELMEQTLAQGRHISNQASESLAPPLYHSKFHSLQQQLNIIKGLTHVTEILVFDLEGRIVHNGSAALPPSNNITLSASHLNQILAGHSIEQQVANLHALFIQPIFIGDKIIGGVKLLLSLEGIHNNSNKIKHLSQTAYTTYIEQLTHNSLIITLLSVIAGAIFTLLVTRKYAQPIHHLVQFAQTIGNKNYCGPIVIDRDDELGDLSHSLNQMASNLYKRTRQIEHLAYYDNLTGLPNRSLFTIMLDKAIINSQQQHQLAVFCIDLDGFKRINDTLGHETGNILINAVSQRIYKNISTSDYFSKRSHENNEWLLARHDGDEFALFVQDISNTLDAAAVAHCIMEALAPTFTQGEHELMISASIGIATYPDNGKDASSLLRNADIAMNRVKAEGKHDFKFFSQAMDASSDHKMSLQSDLRNALKQNELELKYQPIVHTHSGRIIGAEALVRWNSARHGCVPPEEFIPIAEECGLIHEIGKWIVLTALEQLSQWNRNFDANFQLSINISVAQLQKNNLATLFTESITALNINPKNIHLEVTETSLIFNKQASISMLDSLKSIGIKVWLDDFGTGYSSLSHLKLFNIDGVKVDRCFISELEERQEDCELTFAIIAMAKALGLNVVAEGVESIAQWHLLSQSHDLYIQGYLISEALKANDFEYLAFKQNKVYNPGVFDTVN